MKNTDIYVTCPEFDTEHFHLRLVQENDAEDLQKCYGNPIAQKYFNSDNCDSDFHYSTVEEMRACILGWLSEYKQRHYIRFAIVDKLSDTVVGTFEMFGTPNWKFTNYIDGGCLRLDILPEYEKIEFIQELLSLADQKFLELFHVKVMVVKAIPEAIERRAALDAVKFMPYELNSSEFKYFYARVAK